MRRLPLVLVLMAAASCNRPTTTTNAQTPALTASPASSLMTSIAGSYQTIMDDGTTVVTTTQNPDGTSTTAEVDSPSGNLMLQILADPNAGQRTVTEYDAEGQPAATATAAADPAQLAPAAAAHTAAMPFAADELVARNRAVNRAGCDFLHNLDCTARGACCDAHDVGIGFPTDNPPCRGSCGNLVYATLHPNECLRGPDNAACSNAHGTVINCFLSSPGPGPSQCCARNDCGKPQCGLSPGPPPVVLTRPDECAEIVPL